MVCVSFVFLCTVPVPINLPEGPQRTENVASALGVAHVISMHLDTYTAGVNADADADADA